jgi:hypothetical protein
MSQPENLQTTIDNLYTVFAPYRSLSSRFGDCDWLPESAVTVLRRKSLRELIPSDLDVYVNHLWMCGDENDFMHFLPRLAELFIAGELVITAEMFFPNLRYDKWAENERKAVDTFLRESWLALLGAFPFPFEPDEFLCGLAQVMTDLTPLLVVWDQQETLSSLRQLCLFIQHATYCSEWGQHPRQKQQVIDWLFRPQTMERLNQAASAYQNQPFYVEFLEAAETLAHWISSYTYD